MIELKEYKPATDLFPEMSEEQAADLQANIEQRGQRVPILLYKGQIADGKHRYAVWKALEQEGIKRELLTTEFTGTEAELLQEVVSLNRARRHLTPDQLAGITVLDVLPAIEKGAKEGLVEAGRKGGSSKGKPGDKSPQACISMRSRSGSRAQRRHNYTLFCIFMQDVSTHSQRGAGSLAFASMDHGDAE